MIRAARSRIGCRLWLVHVATLGLTLLANGDALAGPPVRGDKAAAERHKAEAFRAINYGDLETGLVELEAAYAAYPHPDFLYNIAVVQEQRANNCQVAHAAYGRFLEACEGCKLLNLGRTRRERLEKRCRVQVTVRSEPSGARIAWDGEPRTGTTPMVLQVWAGKHRLAAEAEGYARTEVEAVVLEETPADFQIRLEPAAEAIGQLRIVNRPPGSVVRVDGEIARGERLSAAAGDREVDIRLRDGRAVALVRDVRPGAVTTVDVAQELARAPNLSLAVDSSPPPDAKGIAAWTSAGVGAAAAAVAVGLGVVASSDADALNDDPNLRPSDRAARGDDARALATGANVAFAVAGTAAATALVLWLWPDAGDDPLVLGVGPAADGTVQAGLRW